MMYSSNYKSPIGTIEISVSEHAITAITFSESSATEANESDLTKACAKQLDEYFGGGRTKFDLPLAPIGTPFQIKVWEALRQIPFGTTISYGALAEMLGDAKLVRAVGGANGMNPVAIVIPCHRVIGAGGSLTGYAGGLWRKQWLLEHEDSGSLFASRTLRLENAVAEKEEYHANR